MRDWLRHRKAALCWHCEKVPVQSYGRACPDCLTVLYAKYEAMKAANGGKLLYLPDDWNGDLHGWTLGGGTDPWMADETDRSKDDPETEPELSPQNA